MAEKSNNWATASMREVPFWRDDITIDEYEKEYEHYYRAIAENTMKEYKPLYK